MELLVLILALVNLLANTAYSSIAPIFPLAAIEKGIPNTYIGFIFSMYSLMKVIMSPFVAVLMNQTGRRAILLRGLVFEGVAIITFGVLDFIQDPVWYGVSSAICRALEGLGNACLVTASYALVASRFPEKVDQVVSTLQTFTALGMASGPLFGSALFALGGFKVPFFVTGAALLVFAVATAYVLPEEDEEQRNTELQQPPSDPSSAENSMTRGSAQLCHLIKDFKVLVISITVSLLIL